MKIKIIETEIITLPDGDYKKWIKTLRKKTGFIESDKVLIWETRDDFLNAFDMVECYEELENADIEFDRKIKLIKGGD